MNIRNGFVSNSSSSSFILRIPKDRVLDFNDIDSWFGIEEKDPRKRQAIEVAFWLAMYLHRKKKEGWFDNSDTLIDVAFFYGTDDVLKKLLYEYEHPEEFPDTEIIAFEADDDRGNIIDYNITEILAYPNDLSFKSENVYAVDEH